MNKDVLSNVVNHMFNVEYYPYIQSPANKDCLEKFIPDSFHNMRGDFKLIATSLSVTASAFLLFLANYG